MASLSVQEKRMAQAVAQHVQALDLEGAVAEQVTLLLCVIFLLEYSVLTCLQTALRTSFFQRMGSKFEMTNLPLLRGNNGAKPVLGWSSQPLQTSMLVMEHSQVSVRIFNDLLCIMGDKMALYPEM